MSGLSKIKNLFAYEDGDTITPRMGVQIAEGYALQQYYDPNTGNVTQTDFSKVPATLFPQAWSSKLAKVIVPSAVGIQWYYNNISDNAGILDESGRVKAAYQSLFEVATVTQNKMTFPALKIKGNLVNKSLGDFTDKYIYFVGQYNGKPFTCQQLIPVQAAVGEAYTVLLSIEGADGSGDETLSADNDFVKYTAYLQLAGNNVTGATYAFQHLDGGEWKNITNAAGYTEVGTNSLKVFDAAVEGTEIFRVKVTYGGKTFYKTMEVSDVHDPYYIEDGCNILGDSIGSGERATFNPKVYERETGEDVTASQGWTFAYTLIDRRDKSVITDFNVSSLTYDNIQKKGGISVRIEASRQ